LRPMRSSLFPYTTLFRSLGEQTQMGAHGYIHLTKDRNDLVSADPELTRQIVNAKLAQPVPPGCWTRLESDSARARIPRASCGSTDRKSTRLNSSHEWISY